MIRGLFLSALVFISASANSSAQSSGSPPSQTAAMVPCPDATRPVANAPHSWVGVSAGVMARNRIGGKDPKYPSAAKKAHVEGTVVLEATVSESGKVEGICVISGPAMLQQSAFDAVKTWKYRPFTLNGLSREVWTQVNVVYTLGG